VTKFKQIVIPENTKKYLKTYLADLPNWPKHLGYFENKSYHVSVVRGTKEHSSRDRPNMAVIQPLPRIHVVCATGWHGITVIYF
jgi:hypothetical protein